MDGGKPLAGATVKLLNYVVFVWAEEKNMPSDGTGAFGFEKLTNKFDNNGGVTGPLRGLKITMYGYRDTTMAVPANGAILKPGDTWFKEIALQPNAIIKGKIVDEEGNGIAAKVSLIGGETKDAKPPPYIVLETMKWAPASFEILSPKGSQQLIIDPTPYDASYFRDTVGLREFRCYGRGDDSAEEKAAPCEASLCMRNSRMVCTSSRPRSRCPARIGGRCR